MFCNKCYNGFGKTTFNWIIWCPMAKTCKRLIRFTKKNFRKGGYKNYLKSSINFDAEKENERIFSIKLNYLT